MSSTENEDQQPLVPDNNRRLLRSCLAYAVFTSNLLFAGNLDQKARLVGSIDLSTKDQALLMAESKAVPPPVRLEFDGDNELIVSSINDIDTPDLALRQHRPVRPLELTATFLALRANGVQTDGQMTFSLGSSQEGFRALPLGGFIVGSHGIVRIYNSDRAEIHHSSIANICGMKGDQDADHTQISGLFLGSQVVGLLVLEGNRSESSDTSMKGHLAENNSSHYCWFSIPDLFPMFHIEDDRIPFIDGSANSQAYVAGPPGYMSNFSPEGVSRAVPPQDCGTTQTKSITLLHYRNAFATLCTQSLQVHDASNVHKVEISKSRIIAEITSEAWNAPIVAISNSIVHMGFTGRVPVISHRVEIVDYNSSKTTVLPMCSIDTEGPISTGGVFRVALSESGKYAALLCGAKVSIYDTNFANAK